MLASAVKEANCDVFGAFSEGFRNLRKDWEELGLPSPGSEDFQRIEKYFPLKGRYDRLQGELESLLSEVEAAAA